MSQSPPIPVNDPIARPRRKGLKEGQKDYLEGLITDAWVKWFQNQTNDIQSAPQGIASVGLTDQAASIASTPISSGVLSSGYYRLTFYFRITRAATTSSSLSVTFGWTDGGVSCSITSGAITGNTTSTTNSSTYTVLSDQSAPLTYATTYASVGATSMQYGLSVLVEKLNT